MWDGYESRRWRVYVRPRILRRDGYRCREARRYGRNVEATVVHHIWPAEDWPEYAWADWNLLSLSAEAHRAMHNDDGSLSALGESWRRRTIPPTPCGGESLPLITGAGTSSDSGQKFRGGVKIGAQEKRKQELARGQRP